METVYNNNERGGDTGPRVRQSKKELRRIDWEIVKRIVSLLYYENGMKRTNIAMKCKLSYGNCLLYLNWFETMDLIKREADRDGYELVSLSEKGKDLYTRQFEEYWTAQR